MVFPQTQTIYTMFTLLAFSFPITKVGACFSTNHSNVKRKTILWLWILWIPLDQIAWQAVVFSFILLLCSTSILVVKLKKEILDLSCYVTLIEKIHPFLLSLKCTALMCRPAWKCETHFSSDLKTLFLVVVPFNTTYCT